MGSIVKTIGKVVKKIGKTIKKIAPILLVAAVAYVGYGYMTGFQSGGWPQVTEWGKNLMGGVSQGQTLSQAATAAGGIPDAAAQAVTAPLTDTTPIAETISTGGIPVEAQGDIPLDQVSSSPTDSGSYLDIGSDFPSDLPMEADTGLLGDSGGLPSEGGLLAEIQESTNTRFNAMMDGFVDNMDSTNLGPSVSNYFMSDSQAVGFGPNKTIPGSTIYNSDGVPAVPKEWVGSTSQSVTPAVTPVASTSPNYLLGMGSGLGPDTGSAIGYNIPHINDPSAMSKIAGMGKKAWGFYKQMWDDNPGMAMWTTANVVKTIAALLDKSDEQESYRKRHVAGFAPGNWGDLRKQYGGNLPTSKPSGIWAGEGRRTASAKTGPKPAGGIRTSAIDRKPQGMIGSQVSRAVS